MGSVSLKSSILIEDTHILELEVIFLIHSIFSISDSILSVINESTSSGFTH